MNFTDEQLEQLNAPLDRSHVKQRNQRGINLSYIEGWHAIAEANRIFGFGAWHSELLNTTCVEQPRDRTSDGTLVPNYTGQDRNGNPRFGCLVAYTATVRVTVGDQFHDGIGYGEGIDYNNAGQAHESAVKEAATDALKRALIHWGNPFGLALYDRTQENVTGTQTPQQPTQRRPAPASGQYGRCEKHADLGADADYFKAGKMKNPAHKYTDPETGEVKWCAKPADPPAADPAWTAAFNRFREALTEAGYTEDNERQSVVRGMTDKHPQELSADELDAMIEHIPAKD